MSGQGFDPAAWIKGLAESATRVRLAPGVIGKSAYICLGIMAVWIIVLWRMSENLTLDCFLAGGGIFATLIAVREMRKMREYAVTNPSLALMEGADITEHQRFEAQAKGQAPDNNSSLSTDPTKPLLQGPVRGGPEENG